MRRNAVLISIRPKWVEKIASGEKTVEVRKTRPSIETPFKCYIYCTKAVGRYWTACCCQIREDDLWKSNTGKVEFNDGFEYWGHGVIGKCHRLNGKVVGEFVCDLVCEVIPQKEKCKTGYFVNQYLFENLKHGEGNPCLTFEELRDYLGDNIGYAWRISDLKIYDKPKSLRKVIVDSYLVDLGRSKIFEHAKRPPQSWCYIEGVEE